MVIKLHYGILRDSSAVLWEVPALFICDARRAVIPASSNCNWEHRKKEERKCFPLQLQLQPSPPHFPSPAWFVCSKQVKLLSVQRLCPTATKQYLYFPPPPPTSHWAAMYIIMSQRHHYIFNKSHTTSSFSWQWGSEPARRGGTAAARGEGPWRTRLSWVMNRTAQSSS